METGIKAIENSYSGRGWQGVNYKDNLSVKDIAKIIRHELKQKYKNAKFSITTDGNYLASNIDITLVADNKTPYNDIETIKNSEGFKKYVEYWNMTDKEIETEIEHIDSEITKFDRTHNINQYHIDSDYLLNDYAKEMFSYIVDLCNSFNYNDSDSQVDYYDVGFYMDLRIGKYDKHFTLVEGK